MYIQTLVPCFGRAAITVSRGILIFNMSECTSHGYAVVTNQSKT